MKKLLLLFLLFTIACGKKEEEDDCVNRAKMITQCVARMEPNYGRPYSQEVCSRQYIEERCYGY